MLSSVGMALGPLVGGWVFDTYHDYRWLYIGSFGLAPGAAAIAIAFPTPPGMQKEPSPVWGEGS
jgi:MFS family permease